MVFRVPEDERALAGYQISDVVDPAPYFQIRSTGRVHHVRGVQRIARGGAVWFSLWFWCDNIAQEGAGAYLSHLRPQDPVCARCAASPHQRGRGRRDTHGAVARDGGDPGVGVAALRGPALTGARPGHPGAARSPSRLPMGDPEVAV